MAAPPANPFPTSLKDLYDHVEGLVTKPLHDLLGSEATARWMGLTRESTITQQAAVRKALEAHWLALRLPSMGDHARLAGQLVALETKVDAMADSLEALSSRLDAVMGQLEGLSALAGRP